MMFFVKFFVEGKPYLLYMESFIGGRNEQELKQYLANSLAITLSVESIEVVKIDDLCKAIGGIPFKIIDFFGMGRKWSGVPLVSN